MTYKCTRDIFVDDECDDVEVPVVADEVRLELDTAPVDLLLEAAASNVVKLDFGQGQTDILAEAQGVTLDLGVEGVEILSCDRGPPGAKGDMGDTGPEGPPGAAVDLADYREDEQLVGAVNSLNMVYVLPDSEKALVADPGVKIKVYYNGQRLHEGGANDYSTSESGGAGTGYDTVTLAYVAPRPGDVVTADYLLKP